MACSWRMYGVFMACGWALAVRASGSITELSVTHISGSSGGSTPASAACSARFSKTATKKPPPGEGYGLGFGLGGG